MNFQDAQATTRHYKSKRDSTYPCMVIDIYANRESVPRYDGIKMCSVVDSYSEITPVEVIIERSGERKGTLEYSAINREDQHFIDNFLQFNFITKLPDAESFNFTDFGSDRIFHSGPYPAYEERIKMIESEGAKDYKEVVAIQKRREYEKKEFVKKKQRLEKQAAIDSKREKEAKILRSIISKKGTIEELDTFDREYEEFQKSKRGQVKIEPKKIEILESEKTLSFSSVADAVNGLMQNIY